MTNVSRDADAKADFLARLEWGVNPFIGGWGNTDATFVTQGEPCQNGSGAGIADNESRRLARDLCVSLQQEGDGSW